MHSFYEIKMKLKHNKVLQYMQYNNIQKVLANEK